MPTWKTLAAALPLALTTAAAAPAAPANGRALHAASLHDRVNAIEDWAGDSPILAVLEIEMAESQPDDQTGARTEVVLHVLDVLRDDLDSGLVVGERVWMEIPGGALDQNLIFSSAAPMLFEGDTVLARLDLGDDGLTFTSIADVLPVADDAVRACVNPSPNAMGRCDGEGAALLPARRVPLFDMPELAIETPILALIDALQ